MVPSAAEVPSVRGRVTVVDFEMACPTCGDGRSTCIGETELDIAYLELEEPCARP